MGICCVGLGLTIERVYLLTLKPLEQKNGPGMRDHRSRVLKPESHKVLVGISFWVAKASICLHHFSAALVARQGFCSYKL